MFSFLYSIDTAILYFVNHLIHTPLLDSIVSAISLCGLLYFGIIIAIVLYLYGKGKSKKVAKILFITLVATYIITQMIKAGVMRPRPYDTLSALVVIGHEMDFSFPSGHTANMTALCYILGKEYDNLKLFMIFPVIIALTRLYLGMHYPSDVIGGFIVGLTVAYGCDYIFTKKYVLN